MVGGAAAADTVERRVPALPVGRHVVRSTEELPDLVDATGVRPPTRRVLGLEILGLEILGLEILGLEICMWRAVPAQLNGRDRSAIARLSTTGLALEHVCASIRFENEIIVTAHDSAFVEPGGG
jgi:hypothetical protein